MSQLAPLPSIASVTIAVRAARYNPALASWEIADAIRVLAKSERALSRLAEQDCNGPSLTPAQYARSERICKKAHDAAQLLGYFARMQFDPRGPAIRLYRFGQPDDGCGLTLY